ncbi:MAG: DNA starvation/stationary phase protection protein [Novosphingobium sp.]|nr:DNA starvation/stationary phase protection protein [Novosphingobium sp.]
MSKYIKNHIFKSHIFSNFRFNIIALALLSCINFINCLDIALQNLDDLLKDSSSINENIDGNKDMNKKVNNKIDSKLNYKLKADSTELNLGLDKTNRQEISNLLTKLLANEYALGIKTQKYHWNLYGHHFGSLHKLFDDQYKEIQDYIDLVAERIRAIGFSTIATLKEFSEITDIEESPGVIPNDLGMIKDLTKDHETVIKLMRVITDKSAELDDHGTNNLIAGLIEKHEKTAWMLRAFLNENKSTLDAK